MSDLSLATVCAWCSRVRSGDGEWHESERAELLLSPATHGICPQCLEKATACAATTPMAPRVRQ